MSKTRKTNITTSRPNPPVKSQTKPSAPAHRPMQSSPQSSPVHHHHNDGHTLFDVFADMNDTSRYSSEPSPSYDSGSSYESFGGGSSDGGGASSDW